MAENILDQVKEAAYRTKLKYPGDTDAMKACRAIAGFELGLTQLLRVYSRDTALQLLDPNKKGNRNAPTMFDVSERHIRRIETIRKKRPLEAARLETMAMNSQITLELAEKMVNHPESADTMEAMWLTATNESRTEFLARIRR